MSQQDLLREVGAEDLKPFRFERVDRNRLLGLLEKRERVIELLELRALEYKLMVRYWSEPGRLPPRRKEALERDLRAVHDAARELLRVARQSKYLDRNLIRPCLLAAGTSRRALLSFLELVEQSVMEDPALRRPPGAPKDRDRPALESLNLDVPRTLHENGISVTTGRDGVFARVLEIVRGAIGRPLPVNTTDVKAAKDALDREISLFAHFRNLPEQND